MNGSTPAGVDRRARFEETALPFLPRVYNVAVRLARRPEDASDLAQETYLRAFRTFDNFRTGTDCKAWLLTILYSVFINRYWKGKRSGEAVSLDAMEDGRDPRPRTDPREIEAGLVHSIDHERPSAEVVAALRDLPEGFRAAVLLVDVEEMSYEDAASVLQCPLGTLRSRLYRARKLLFSALHEHARAAGYAKASGED
jgi:RNA polymerase sigma-70 factor (ECF subfamily)